MAELTRTINPFRWLPRGGRRSFPKAGICLVWAGLLLMAGSPAAFGGVPSQGLSLEKGDHAMQQTAAAPIKEMPPLDRSQPSRVETFTFGLG